MMKAQKYIVGILILAALTMAAPAAHAQDTTSNLVGHWTLDETAGTTAADSAGTNNGTMNGGLDASNDSVGGQIGTALNFDGTNDYVALGTAAALGPTANFTVSAWVYTAGGVEQAIYSAGDVDQNYWAFLISAADQIFVRREDGGAADFFVTTDLITPNAWNHVAVTKVAGGGVDLAFYINGQPAQTFNTGGTWLGSGNKSLGIRLEGPSGPFNGMMDDVRLYDRALTAEDITALYLGGPGTIRYNNTHNVMEYQDGTQWIAMGQERYVPNAVSFDGTNDYINLTTSTGPASETQWSGSFWVNHDGSGGTQVIYDKRQNGADDLRVDIDLVSNELRFLAQNSSSTTVLNIRSNALTANTWHHVAYSFDLTNAANRHIYIDDVSSIQTVTTYNTAETMDFSAVFEGIGGTGNSGGAKMTASLADFWLDTGTYIDLSIAANRAKFYNSGPVYLGADGSKPTGTAPDIFLSGDTANWSTNKGTGGGFTENGALTDAGSRPGDIALPEGTVITGNLFGHWRLNETAGSNINDSAGSIDGTWTDGSGNSVAEESIAGKVGTGAIDFDGTNDRIEILLRSSTLDWMNEVSACTWFYSDASQNRVIWRWHNSSDNSDILELETISSSGQLRATVRLSDLTYYRATSANMGAGYWNNAWHHACLVFDNALSEQNVKLYVDGQVIATRDTPALTVRYQSTSWFANMNLGYNPGNGTYFNGKIDDMRFYDNKALTEKEVKILYAGGCPSPLEPGGSLTYNTTSDQMQFCNGEDWIAMGPPGDGGAGCSNPAGTAGSLTYNTVFRKMQYCEGDTWIGIGGDGVNTALATNLVGHWKFDETSGTNAADSSGNGYDGTLVTTYAAAPTGGATWDSAGVSNGTIVMDGTNDMVWVGNTPTETDTIFPLTVAAWINMADLPTTAGNNFAIAGQYETSTSQTWRFGVADVSGRDKLYLQTFQTDCNTAQLFNNVTNADQFNSPADVDRWIHVAFTMTAAADLYLYIDGVSVRSWAGVSTNLCADGTIPLTIGGISNDNSNIADDFEGKIDDLRIYGRALSAGEIAALYNQVDCPNIGDVCDNGSVYAGQLSGTKLYVPPADNSSGIAWNNGNATGRTLTSATSTTNGASNTATIITVDSDSGTVGTQPHQAAQLCANLTAHGRSDWYLPSQDELNVIYTNEAVIGGFNTSGAWPAGYYHTSTENSTNTVEVQRFSDGWQTIGTKEQTLPVRCVRQ